MLKEWLPMLKLIRLKTAVVLNWQLHATTLMLQFTRSRRLFADLGEKVEATDRAACEAAIKELEEAARGEDKDLIVKRTEALNTAAQKIGEN